MLETLSPARESLALCRRHREAGRLDALLAEAARCMSLAGDEDDGETSVHAFTGIGHLHQRRGEPGKALVWYQQAVDAAKSFQLSPMLGMAYHNLWLSAVQSGDGLRARKTWDVAWEMSDDLGRDVLAADHALIRMQDSPASADTCWHMLHRVDARSPCEAAALACARLLAAVVVGVPQRIERALSATEALANAPPSGEGLACSLADAVEAMLRLRRFEAASDFAAKGVGVAKVRGEVAMVARLTELAGLAAAERPC